MSRADRTGVKRLGGPLAGVILGLLAFTAQGEAAAQQLPTSAADLHQMTPADLGAFFDGMVPYAIGQANIAGASIAVVADGRLVFAKGYGFADVKSRRPVIADQTLFRAGSVSKLFTWTAVMQLVQAGKLDLDRDINTYLDFKVPAPFGRPITLRDAMTHSTGFEDAVTDLFVNDASQLYPLRRFLLQHMPPLLHPPGEVVAYSNYATALAGYIVQRISGEPYDEYIARHILLPLGMTDSTFQQPLPPKMQPYMATGYRQASDDDPVPFEYVEAAPAGALTTTVTDMARFMLAQLGGGSLDGAQILEPATIRQMHTPQGRPLPGMNSMDLGFYDENRNGLRIVGHAGDTGAFHSDMHLLLDRKVGFFIMVNSTGTGGAADDVRVALFRAFLDRYFPYTPPVEATLHDAAADVARVTGFYASSRHTALRIFNALGQSPVSAAADGQIETGALTQLSGVPKRWREVAPLTWREVNGQAHLRFVADEAGNVRYWVSDDTIPVEINQRVHGLGQSSWLHLLGGLFVAVILLAVAGWVGGAIIRGRFRRPLVLPQRKASLRLASRIGAVIYLVLIVGWLGFFASLSGLDAVVSGQLLGWFIPLYLLGVLAIIGSLAMIMNAGLRLRLGPGSALARTGELILGLAGIYGIWGVIHLGLANFLVSF